MGGKTSEDSIEIPSNLPSWFANISKKMGLSAEKDAYARPDVSDTTSFR